MWRKKDVLVKDTHRENEKDKSDSVMHYTSRKRKLIDVETMVTSHQKKLFGGKKVLQALPGSSEPAMAGQTGGKLSGETSKKLTGTTRVLKFHKSQKQVDTHEKPQPAAAGTSKHVSYLTKRKQNTKTRSSVKSLKIKKTGRKTIFNLQQALKQKALGQKPDWLKIKKLSTDLTKERKSKKLTNYEKVVKAKKLWEEARIENCSAERRAQLLPSIYELMSNYLIKSIYAHDSSRIIQWLIKYGTPEIRTSICNALQPFVLDMMQRKFSNYIVKQFLKCGDKHCGTVVIAAIKGNVVKLMNNTFAAPLVDLAYSKYTTSEQKRVMELECLKTSHVVLTGGQLKDIKSILENTSIENKTSIIEEIKENIFKFIKKGLTTSLILHVITLEFLEAINLNEKEEVLTAYHPHVLDLITTKQGSRISMQCCWYLPKKVKKTIIKSLKGHVVQVCTSEEGYWMLLALFDSVDDTVLLNKIVLSEILDNIEEIVKNEKGRKVILYLIAHRDTTYFHPHVIDLLKTADTCIGVKKSLATRRSEILHSTVESLLKCISSDVTKWFNDPSIAMVLVAILKNSEGSFYQETLANIATFLCSDAVVCESETVVPLIEDLRYHQVVKKILRNDELRSNDKDTLAFHLAAAVTKERMNNWIMSNRGCFVLVHILEAKKKTAVSLLLSKIDAPLVEKIKSANTIGSKILITLLSCAGKDIQEQ